MTNEQGTWVRNGSEMELDGIRCPECGYREALDGASLPEVRKRWKVRLLEDAGVEPGFQVSTMRCPKCKAWMTGEIITSYSSWTATGDDET